MFLRHTRRWKDGKEHLYWSVVENRRCKGGRILQKTVLYLGEINDSQKEQWIRAIEVFDENLGSSCQLKLFSHRNPLPECAPDGVQVRLDRMELHRPRQWGACWLFTELWKELRLDIFWRERLGTSREGTDWEHVLQLLCCYRLLEPGSEWRLHRHWFDRSAMGNLLDEDFSIAAKDTLYRCHDLLLEHKDELFSFLRGRWEDLFGVKFDILLYDLTSTYFESDPPFPPDDKRKFGYSRDKRSDCVQVVIALVVTPEGFPLAYEVMPGNTADKTTLRGFLEKIQTRFGKARRTWIMDRGIPTEEVLAEMRASDPPVHYLVGTPKGRLTQLESELLALDWQHARDGVEVKLLPRPGELYVLARSRARVCKERAMRRRQLKKLWARLRELAARSHSRDALLIKLGQAKEQSPSAWRLIDIQVDADGTLHYSLDRKKLKAATLREGRYLLRSNLSGEDPAHIWNLYMRLVEIEECFRNLKGDLSIRPIHHQLEHRIEAHIMIAFLAFCMHTTLRHKLRQKAPGLTPRSVLEQLAGIQMLDVKFPTSDGRTLLFERYTTPDKTQKLLLAQLGLELPEQSPPRITNQQTLEPLN
jgi:transposase